MYSSNPAEWKIHVIVPWAKKENVGSLLDNSLTVTLDDGSVIVSEWGQSAIDALAAEVGKLSTHPLIFHKIFMENIDEILDKVPTDDDNVIVLNMADGLELDGWPGTSVVKGLEARNLTFTGGDSRFFGK